MAGVSAGLDDGDVHAATPHVLDREVREPRTYAAPLMARIDADDLDHAHPFVECIERNGNETNWESVRDGHKDVTVVARTARSDGLSLVRLPVWMQAEKDVLAEDVPH
jgi:hypothetical protein